MDTSFVKLSICAACLQCSMRKNGSSVLFKLWEVQKRALEIALLQSSFTWKKALLRQTPALTVVWPLKYVQKNELDGKECLTYAKSRRQALYGVFLPPSFTINANC